MIKNIQELVSFIADNGFTVKVEKRISTPFGWITPEHEFIITAYGSNLIRTKSKLTDDDISWSFEHFKQYLENNKWSLIPEEESKNYFPVMDRKEQKGERGMSDYMRNLLDDLQSKGGIRDFRLKRKGSVVLRYDFKENCFHFREVLCQNRKCEVLTKISFQKDNVEIIEMIEKLINGQSKKW